MVSSYQFSERVDTVSVLAASLGALWSLLRTVALLLGLAIIAAFAIATYPRTAPRTAVRS